MKLRTASLASLSMAVLLAACAPPGRDPGGSGGNGGGNGGNGGGNGGSGGSGGNGGSGGIGGSGGGSGGTGGGSGGSGGGSGGSGGGSGGSGGFGGGSGGSGGGSGGSGGGGNPDAGMDIVVTPWEGGGMNCGEMTTTIGYSPKTPDVIISFDKSGSMSKAFGTGTRMSTEVDILVPLVTMYEKQIRWGFEEFPMNTAAKSCPSGLSCCAEPVTVPPAFMNATAVNGAIRGMGGSSSRINTPTPMALQYCHDFYLSFVDGIKERYVLLSTDGEPNCPSTPNACTASEDNIKKLASQGVKTIVLGVSEEVAASACLNKLALAGGVPKPGGPPHFYPGSDPASLKMHLETIISGIAKPSCFIDFTSAPPDPTKVAVFFDGVQIPWDPMHIDGWDYVPGSTTKIQIFGSYCAKVESFAVKDIGIRYGCPPCGGTVGC